MPFVCWQHCHWAAVCSPACFSLLFLCRSGLLLLFPGVKWHIFLWVDMLKLLHRGLLPDTYPTCRWLQSLRQNTLSYCCVCADVCLSEGLHQLLFSLSLWPSFSLLFPLFFTGVTGWALASRVAAGHKVLYFCVYDGGGASGSAGRGSFRVRKL